LFYDDGFAVESEDVDMKKLGILVQLARHLGPGDFSGPAVDVDFFHLAPCSEYYSALKRILVPIQEGFNVVIVPWVSGLEYFCEDESPPSWLTRAGNRGVFKIFGSVESVFEAKAVLAHLFGEDFHGLTHPGVVRSCVEVSDWADRLGSPISEGELRHIQKQWGVGVRWESGYCWKSSQFVLFGLESAVRRASAYISRVVRAEVERLKFGVVQNQLLEAVPSGSKASSVKSHRKDNRLRLSWSARAGEWETRRLRRRQQRLRSWEQGFKLRSLGSKWSV